MTVTSASPLLILFRSRIEAAVALVPDMGAEEKLSAVQFWNVVSEKLQEIVNNSAADINALALRMDEEQVDKLSLELDTESSHNLSTDGVVCTSNFISSSSNFAVCTEADSHFENSEINNSESVARYLNSEAALSEIDSTPLPKHLPEDISQAISLESISNSDLSSKHVSNLSQFSTIQTLTKSNCVIISNLTSVSSEITSKHSLLTDTHLDLQSGIECGLSSSTVTRTVRSRPRRERPKRPISRRTKSSKASTLDNTKRQKTEDANLSESHSGQTVCLPRKCATRSSTLQSVSNEESFVVNSDMEDKIASNSERIICKENSAKEELKPSLPVISEETTEMKNHNGTDTPEKVDEVDKKSLDPLMDIEDDDSCEKEDNDSCGWRINKPYGCRECDSKFATKGNLMVHLRRHTGERPFSCPQCSACFSTRGNLKRHIKTHSGEKPWKCAQCETCFTEKKSLKVHMRRHTGEKPYQCAVCGKKFSQTGILHTHMAMHLEQKSHLCEHCGKSFRQKSQLRLHMLRHEGVKKYCCDVCLSRFLTKGDLERHKRVHTGERPFNCDLCGKTFTRQQSLNEHMNRHYGLKPYECKYCGKTFAEMSACYKHIKFHEKQQSPGDSEKVLPQNGTHQTIISANPDLQLTSSDAISNTIIGSRNEYEELSAQKFAVILHGSSDTLEVINDMSVENQDHLKSAFAITSSSDSTSMDLTNHISHLAAINLLATASTHQENF